MPTPPIQSTIDFYEAIALSSGDMLQAARQGDWSRFEQIENDCARLIEQLRSLSTDTTRDAAFQRARMKALREVLRNDAQIRTITEPAIHRIGAYLGAAPPGADGA